MRSLTTLKAAAFSATKRTFLLLNNNAEIRLEYDKMRKRVSKIYRKILVASVEENPKKHKEALEKMLKKYRKVSLVVVLILSAIITPPDIASQVIVSVPIIILYEISIFISRAVIRKQEKILKKQTE